MAAQIMSDFNAISRTEYNPRIKVDILEKGLPYPILSFKLVEVKNNLFGKGKRSECAVVAVVDLKKQIQDGQPGTIGDFFLPRRFNMIFDKKKIDLYNEKPNLNLVFEGLGVGREHVVRLEK